jgi:hypothetical protein
LNAEPAADAAFPGSFGAVALRQVCDGCPLPDGFLPANAGAAASAGTVTRTRISLLITRLLSSALERSTTLIRG